MIVGHRGASGYEPENTLLSFQKAVDLGADWIEFDLHRSADGHVVVIHDATVDRTTNGHGKVRDMTLAKLRKLDAGKGQKIPTFQEVIDLAKGKVRMIPELKQKGIESDVLDVIQQNEVVDDCIVSCFYAGWICRCKQLEPKIRTAAIYSHGPIDFDVMAHDVMADSLFIRKDMATLAYVKTCQSHGFTVNVWVVDTPEEIAKIAKMRPDFMTSDYPDRLVNRSEAEV